MPSQDLFQELLRYCSLDITKIPEELKTNFRTYANEYFDRNRTPANHNRFFESFTRIWLFLISRRHYFKAVKLWQFALSLAFDWQSRNKPNKIHKGTPYYFAGVTGILNNELENGFLSFHQAMKEDQRLSDRRTPQAPALWFATLDSTRQDQFFRPKIEQIATYLSERIDKYSSYRGGSLGLNDFRRRFLRRRVLKEEVFYFVYLMFKLRKLEVETHKILKKNIFSSLLHARILFDFCLVSDKIIEHRNPDRLRPNARLAFRNEIEFLTRRRLLSFNSSIFHALNRDFNRDFGSTVYSILFGRSYRNLSGIEKDFALAYGIRNFGAHKMHNQPVLYNRMIEVTQSILNTIFFAVEKLY